MKGNNKIKRFMMRVNRGVVLGLILGILLVAFVVADGIKFKKDSATIRENIVSYITSMAELNGSFGEASLGRAITAEEKEAMGAGLERIFDQYYADPTLAENITVYDGYDRDEIAAELEVWFGKTAGFELISVEAQYDSDIFRISFERQGYSYAIVRLNDLPLSIKLTEPRGNEVDIFLGGGPSYLIDPKYSDDVDVWGVQRERTIYISGTVYITLVEGEWKILMSDVYTEKAPELD